MKNSLLTKSFLSVSISALTLQALPVLALEIEEVVVTAQKREQSANDVGMAIQALSGDAMKDLGVADTTDLAAVVPGLTFSDSGYGTPVYTLRGVGFNENSVQAASTVGVYVDEVAIPYPLMTKGALLDVERVEVMKGPQGTLYGRNSTGGAINFVANKPGDQFEASVTAGYGEFQTSELSGFVSTPLSDTVGIRVAAKTTQSSEGWQESLSTGDKLGEQDKSAARAIVELKPTDELDVTLSVSYWEDKSDTQAPVMTREDYKNPASPIVATIAPYASGYSGDDIQKADWTQNSFYKFEHDLESTSASVSVNYALTYNLNLTSLTSYSKLKDDSLYPRDGVSGFPSSTTVHPSNLKQAGADDNQANSNYQNHAEIEAFSQELRLSGELDTMNWIAGVYYAKDEVYNDRFVFPEYTSHSEIAGVVNLDNMAERTKQESSMWAIFTHAEWQLTEDLNLITGLRYTEDEKDFEGCFTYSAEHAGNGLDAGEILGGGVPAGACVSRDEVTGLPAEAKKALNEESVSGRVGVDYSLSNDIMLYASYSRGFKSGSFPTLTTVQNSSFDPAVQEQLDAFEVGFKATLDEGAAQLNGGVFFYDYQDKQILGTILDPVWGALSRLKNAPDSEVLGAELELQWQPAEGWYLGGGITYIESEANEYVDFDPGTGEEVSFAGDAFPLSPKLTANWIVNYETDLSDKLVGSVGVDGSYSGETNSLWGDDPIFNLDSYTLWNARASVGSVDDTWNLNFWVRNMTNEFYSTSADKAIDFIIQFNGMPRTYGVEFTYNWM